MRRQRTLAAVAAVSAAAALLAACDGGGIQDVFGTVPESRIKFFNFGVGAPGVNFYLGDRKITAISSTSCTPLPAPPADSLCVSRGVESTVGVVPGGAAAGALYAGVTPGQYTVSGRIAAATDNGLAVAAVPVTVAANKAYSFFLSGIYNTTTKQVDAFAVEDEYPRRPSFDSTYVRFVNAISNSQPLSFYLRNPTTGALRPVAANVAYKSGSAFVAFPVVGATDFVVRVGSATTDFVVRTAVTQDGGRAYTVTARGDATVSATGTSTSRPQLDNTANF